jgi:hypothetical protein
MRRRNKRPSTEKKFPAKLASGKIRYYETEARARAAQVSSLAQSQRGQQAKKAYTEKTEAAMVRPHNQDAIERYPFFPRVNSTEQKFLRFAARRDLDVGRNGWPDFCCKSPSGGLAAVEVKHRMDPLSPDQKDCAAYLEAAGIDVYVFNSGWSRRRGAPALVPWRRYVEEMYWQTEWRETDSRAQAPRRATTSSRPGTPDSPLHANLGSDEDRIHEHTGDPNTLH